MKQTIKKLNINMMYLHGIMYNNYVHLHWEYKYDNLTWYGWWEADDFSRAALKWQAELVSTFWRSQKRNGKNK